MPPGFRVDQSSQKNGLNMEKSPIFLGAVGSENGQTGVSLALNAEHARQRRALGYLFTNSALLQQESLLKLHVHKLMGALKKKAAENQAVDFASWCKFLQTLYPIVDFKLSYLMSAMVSR